MAGGHTIACKIGFLGLALAGLVAAGPAVAQDCKPLRPLASINMKPWGGRYLLPVKINKIDTYMVLDSAGYDGIYPEALSALKLKQHDYGAKLMGSDGSTATYNTLVDEMQLGQVTFGADRYYFVLADRNPEFATNNIAGELGLLQVNGVDMDFDFGGNKLNFFATDHCDGKVLYWKSDVVSTMPFEFSDGRIRVKAKLDGKEFKAILSTGNSISTASLPIVADRLGFDPNAPDVENIGQADDPVYRKRFKTLDFDGIAISNPQFTVIPDKIKSRVNQSSATGTSVRADDNRLDDMFIGTNILSKLHIYAAVKERRLYITPAAAPAGQ